MFVLSLSHHDATAEDQASEALFVDNTSMRYPTQSLQRMPQNRALWLSITNQFSPDISIPPRFGNINTTQNSFVNNIILNSPPLGY